jgi:fructose-1,6-bisphosphatase
LKKFYFSDGELCIVNADCVETTDSICSNFVCTSSVGTQTSSKKNASVQTTQSLESISDGPLKKDKRPIRNYIKYNKLDNSDATKFSFDEESTQCKYLKIETHFLIL